jgi:prepilin-type N-terminal cleavage/methylation domain-containing protein
MRPQSGFTLVEVLVALVIVGLVGAATAESFRLTTNHLGENARYIEAAALAQSALEDLRTLAYDSMRSAEWTTDDGFLVTTKVVKDRPDRGMKEIVVTASWEWKGQRKSYEIETVYVQPTKD